MSGDASRHFLPVLFSLRDASTVPVTRSGTPAMSDVWDWRDHVARAAAADVGRAADEETILQARELADRWLFCARLGLGILVALGALFGWLATSVQLRPADGQVHAEWALMMIVAGPWGCLALRGCTMLLLHWRNSLLLDWLVPILLRLRNWLAPMSLLRSATPQDLTTATPRQIYKMLDDTSSGRSVSAGGNGVFWTAYAVAAVATILIVTNHVALGFGFGWTWESSWMWPSFRREVVEFVRAAVEFPGLVLGVCIGSDGLTPVASAPAAPDGDPEAFAVRQSWVCALTAGVGAYLLLPMALWTLFNAVCAYRRAKRWQPVVVAVPRSAATATRCRNAPPVAPLRPPSAVGGMCTHVVRLERPGEAAALPAPLDRLADLGDVDAAADLKRVRGVLRAGPARVAVVGWLPASPDRGVLKKLQTLADASTEAPLLVLDGGHVLRRAEPARAAAIRLHDWRAGASQTGVTPFECDLAELTDASRRDLARAVGHGPGPDGGREPATVSGSGPAGR